ncbi:MAG: hypothetical protein JWN36_2354 [Microbacteriaceae bacterium]|nr:hypothetical protein [Microbacteriaceae bacterium]
MAAVALTAFLTLAGTGVASATWTASSTATTSATAATASVSAAYASGSPSLNGVVYTAANVATISTVTISNTGTAPLAYSLTVTGTATSATTFPLSSAGLAAWTEATCATPSNWGTFAAPPTLPAGAASGAASASLQLCLATRFTGTYANARGQSIAATVKVTGTVGTWTTSASLPVTQSIRVGDVAPPTCSTSLYGLLNTQATETWAAVNGTGVTYRIVYAASGAVVVPTATTATSATFQYTDLAGASNALLIQSMDSFGSVSAGTPITLTRSSLLSLGVLVFSVGCG